MFFLIIHWLFSFTWFLDPIRKLPLELSLTVLSHLNATDLCLAGCVWNDLACDELLWMGYGLHIHFIKKWYPQIYYVPFLDRLCRNWGYHHSPNKIQSYRKLYLILDEGSLIFCADAEKVCILLCYNLLVNYNNLKPLLLLLILN